MIRIREAIVVEGRYDANTLRQIVDAPIFETGGFGVFNDNALLNLLRTAAEKRGLIVLTDSDGAGFVIRRYLSGAIDPKKIKHAYIPDVAGNERRKDHASKEGKLGVEGMPTQALEEALRRSGAFDESNTAAADPITYTDLYEAGLSGKQNSAEKRRAFLRRIALPERLTGATLLKALNAFLTRQDFLAALQTFNG